MRPGRRRIRIGMVTCFVVSLVVAVAAFPGEAHAEPMIEVAASPRVVPALLLEDTTLDITVSNPGTEPLSAVDLTVIVSSANAYEVDTVTGPVVAIGNADDVLDPGEEWTYEAVVQVQIPLVIEASATAPDSTVVTASRLVQTDDINPAGVLFPVDVSMVPDVASSPPGGQVEWTVTATNISSFPIELTQARQRVLPPVRTSPIPFTPLGTPVDQGDGDDLLSPGETWRWDADTVVEIDGSLLEVNLTVLRVDAAAPDQFISASPQSGPVSVVAPTTQPPVTTEPAPTVPDSGALPPTGVEATTGVIALIVAVLGVLLVIVARPRPGRSRSAIR